MFCPCLFCASNRPSRVPHAFPCAGTAFSCVQEALIACGERENYARAAAARLSVGADVGFELFPPRFPALLFLLRFFVFAFSVFPLLAGVTGGVAQVYASTRAAGAVAVAAVRPSRHGSASAAAPRLSLSKIFFIGMGSKIRDTACFPAAPCFPGAKVESGARGGNTLFFGYFTPA